MPVYEFVCVNCGKVFEKFYEIDKRVDYFEVPEKCMDEFGQPRSRHHNCKRVPFPTALHIRQRKLGRVYHQWKGNPGDCPPDIRQQLEKQDKPKDLSIFECENESFKERRKKLRIG